MSITKELYEELKAIINAMGYVAPRDPAYIEYLDLIDKVDRYEAEHELLQNKVLEVNGDIVNEGPSNSDSVPRYDI